jgi:hypothetical protein
MKRQADIDGDGEPETKKTKVGELRIRGITYGLSVPDYPPASPHYSPTSPMYSPPPSPVVRVYSILEELSRVEYFEYLISLFLCEEENREFCRCSMYDEHPKICKCSLREHWEDFWWEDEPPCMCSFFDAYKESVNDDGMVFSEIVKFL